VAEKDLTYLDCQSELIRIRQVPCTTYEDQDWRYGCCPGNYWSRGNQMMNVIMNFFDNAADKAEGGK